MPVNTSRTRRERHSRYSPAPSKPASPSEDALNDLSVRVIPEATADIGDKLGRYNYQNFPPDPDVWRADDFIAIAQAVISDNNTRPPSLLKESDTLSRLKNSSSNPHNDHTNTSIAPVTTNATAAVSASGVDKDHKENPRDNSHGQGHRRTDRNESGQGGNHKKTEIGLVRAKTDTGGGPCAVASGGGADSGGTVTETVTETRLNSTSGSRPGAGARAKLETGKGSKRFSENGALTEFGVKTETKTETRTETATKAGAATEAGDATEVGAATGAASETGTKSDVETVTATEAATASKTTTDSGTKTGAGTGAETATGAGTAKEFATKTATEADTATESGIGTEAGTEIKTGIGADAVAGMGTVPETGAGNGIGTGGGIGRGTHKGDGKGDGSSDAAVAVKNDSGNATDAIVTTGASGGKDNEKEGNGINRNDSDDDNDVVRDGGGEYKGDVVANDGDGNVDGGGGGGDVADDIKGSEVEGGVDDDGDYDMGSVSDRDDRTSKMEQEDETTDFRRLKRSIDEQLARKSVSDIRQALDHLHGAFDKESIPFAPVCNVNTFLALLASEISFMKVHAHERNLALCNLIKSRKERTNMEMFKEQLTHEKETMSKQIEKEAELRELAAMRTPELETELEETKLREVQEIEATRALRDSLVRARHDDLEGRRRLDRMRLKVAAIRGEMIIPTADQIMVEPPPQHEPSIWDDEYGIDSDGEDGSDSKKGEDQDVNGAIEQRRRTTWKRPSSLIGLDGVWRRPYLLDENAPLPIQASGGTSSTDLAAIEDTDIDYDVDEDAMEFRLLKNRLAMVQQEAVEWSSTLQAERNHCQLLGRAKQQLEEELIQYRQNYGCKSTAVNASRLPPIVPRGNPKMDGTPVGNLRVSIRAALSNTAAPAGPNKRIRKTRKSSKPSRGLIMRNL